MHSWASWTAKTVLVTTGFAVAGGGLAGAAFAGTGTNAGNVSVLNGNQVSVPVSVPSTSAATRVALLGGAQADVRAVRRSPEPARCWRPALRQPVKWRRPREYRCRQRHRREGPGRRRGERLR